MQKRPASQTLLKVFNISTVAAPVAPDLLKLLAILLDTTVRKSGVDAEDLNHTESHKKDHISLGDQQSYYLQVFQRLY